MEVLCPKCNSFSLEFETVATDIECGTLTMIDDTYCCSCEYKFLTVSKYKLEHMSNEVVECE